MRTTGKVLALVLTVTALVPPGAAAAGPKPLPPAVPGIAWTACPEDPSAQCGTLRVPVDWAQPRGATFDLAVARRRATDPSARIGSLVINPGGPGGSGVDFALWGSEYFSPELRRRFDIVGFDPRGVARSNPVLCSLDLLERLPSPVLTSRADFQRRAVYNQRLGADCRSRTGPVFDHVDTLSVVRDIDALRGALGDKRLTFYGVSYGTLMGQQYAEVFPQNVRALALDSNMDHSLGTAGFLDTEAAAVQDAFDEFVAWCDRDASCALHGRDVRAVWNDLLARAGRGELLDPFDPSYAVTQLDLIGFAFSIFYGPDWAFLAEIMVALETGVVPASGARAGLRGQWAPIGESVEYSFPAVFCQDWSLPVASFPAYDAHLDRSATIAPEMRFSPLALDATVSCLGWPARVNNPQRPLRVPAGTNKLLLVNSLHDPATGYAWAANAAQQLGDAASLLTYEGWGHGVYGRSPCVDAAVDGYLISLVVPATGTRCPAAPPATVTAQRRSAGVRPVPPGPPRWLAP